MPPTSVLNMPSNSKKLCRFSAGKPRPQSDLDAIKFLCKDLWTVLWKKQIDNLKTNHRGIFVLTDNRFQPLSRMSVDRRAGAKALDESLNRAQLVSTRSGEGCTLAQC
jgi:trafficking protein particle complex subunit 6